MGGPTGGWTLLHLLCTVDFKYKLLTAPNDKPNENE